MRVPLSWLQQFTPVAASARDRASVEELRRVFDSLGLVVEGIEHVGEGLEHIVLARVLEITPIPKADRIRRIVVDAGSEPLEIVCGAWNFVEGDVVPLAPVGTELPGGMKIAQRNMRGVTSNGMLCSGRELGLSEDSAGLLVLASTGSKDGPLPSGLELGMALTEYLGISPDAVFDLAAEPNRPDALSILGIARDVAARLRLPLEVPTPVVHESGPKVDVLATLHVDAPQACQRFVARVLLGVSSIASDATTAQRLVLCGMRPINAIVDASNYVMLELGQPSHPYDLDRVAGPGINVRFAHRGEELVTLDGETRVLGTSTDSFGAPIDVADLLICDAKDRPIGLAGVMGGASSEIDDTTANVLLEVAEFDPLTIGRTAARLGLRSEASTRFWRGVDPEGLVRAADRICELVVAMHEHAGAKLPVVATGMLDSAPIPRSRARVNVRIDRLNSLLGTALSSQEIVSHLDPIGYTSNVIDGVLDVEIPSFRPDSSREVDVIEEVARQYGYEHIGRTERRSPRVGRLSRSQHARRTIRRVLAGLGAHEAWTSSIVDPDRAGVGNEHPIELTHPIVPVERALRTHLLSGLLAAVSYNAGHRNGSVRLFEIGHVFSPPAPSDGEPVEYEQVGAIFAQDGDDASVATRALWVVAEALGLADDALSLCQSGRDGATMQSDQIALGCHPSRSATVVSPDGTVIGAVGEVDTALSSAFDLSSRRIGWLVLNADALFALPSRHVDAAATSKFPSSDVDLAFVVDESVSAERVGTLLRATAGQLCEFVHLVDVYRGSSIEPGARSLTFRLRFCALDHTLTDEEVGTLRARCVEVAQDELGARLRS